MQTVSRPEIVRVLGILRSDDWGENWMEDLYTGMPDIEARSASRHRSLQQGKSIDGRNLSMTSDSSDQQLRAMLGQWSLDIAIDAETASDPRLTALAVGLALSRCTCLIDHPT